MTNLIYRLIILAQVVVIALILTVIVAGDVIITHAHAPVDVQIEHAAS